MIQIHQIPLWSSAVSSGWKFGCAEHFGVSHRVIRTLVANHWAMADSNLLETSREHTCPTKQWSFNTIKQNSKKAVLDKTPTQSNAHPVKATLLFNANNKSTTDAFTDCKKRHSFEGTCAASAHVELSFAATTMSKTAVTSIRLLLLLETTSFENRWLTQ